MASKELGNIFDHPSFTKRKKEEKKNSYHLYFLERTKEHSNTFWDVTRLVVGLTVSQKRGYAQWEGKIITPCPPSSSRLFHFIYDQKIIT